MPDLRVVAVITAKPGSGAAVREALTTLVAATREEPGCLAYELFESTVEPGAFVTVETWKAQADLDGHMKTPHIAAAFATIGDQLATAPVIHPLTPVA